MVWVDIFVEQHMYIDMGHMLFLNIFAIIVVIITIMKGLSLPFVRTCLSGELGEPGWRSPYLWMVSVLQCPLIAIIAMHFVQKWDTPQKKKTKSGERAGSRLYNSLSVKGPMLSNSMCLPARWTLINNSMICWDFPKDENMPGRWIFPPPFSEPCINKEMDIFLTVSSSHLRVTWVAP